MSTTSNEDQAGSPESASTSKENQAPLQEPIALFRELILHVCAALLDHAEGSPEDRDPHEDGVKSRLLTPEEVSDFLGVSTRTVGRLAREGELPSTWVGRQRRFVPEDVENYVRSQSNQS